MENEESNEEMKNMNSDEEWEDIESMHQKKKVEKKKLKKSKRPPIVQRSEAALDISEFNLNEVGKERVKLADLIKTSQKLLGDTASSVNKQLKKSKNLESLSVPLSKQQLTKIKRASGYEKVCSELSKWQPIVRSNESADQLIFPLRKPEVKQDVAEEVEMLDKEEAKLRFGEYMKHRALVSYSAIKAKRQSKIKSKRYHRVLKREKLKKIVKEFEDEGKMQAAADLVEKMRILERITLKHKNTGKWAKIQKLRAKYCPEARMALKEDQLISRELTQKKSTDLSGGSADAKDSLLIHDMMAGGESGGDDGGKDSEEEPEREAPPPASLSEKHVPGDFNFTPDETVLDSVRPRTAIDVMEDEDVMEEEEAGVNMSEAFADEDIIEEFKAEKKSAEEARKGKVIDNFLPGWGSWGGPGINVNQRKRKRFIEKVPEEKAPKKKSTLGNVIICDQKNEKLEKLLVRDLPFPYNKAQFESHICQPVSHTWNPMSSVRSLTAPRVRTRMGQIIRPLDMEDYGLGEEEGVRRSGGGSVTNKEKEPVTAF